MMVDLPKSLTGQLGEYRRFQTLYEIFSELNRSGSGRSEAPERGPVLLLLGGGMAAGKSTVREIIGHDDFWSKVRSSTCTSPKTHIIITQRDPMCPGIQELQSPWSTLHIASCC